MEALTRIPIANKIGVIKRMTAAAVGQLATKAPFRQPTYQFKFRQPLFMISDPALSDKLNAMPARRQTVKAASNGSVSGADGVNGSGEGDGPTNPIEKLEQIGLRNVTREARAGELDPVFERDEEMAELSKRLKGRVNALLIGDTGVGKTAIVEGLAQEWKDEEKTFFFSLGMKDLDRSVLEPQLKMIVETVQEAFRQGYLVYILMDELHLHEQAGVLELLKEPLARPGFQVIGATTKKEFYRYFNNDATKRRFGDPIEIQALAGDRLRRLVRNIIPVILERLKGSEKIEVPPASKHAAIELSPLAVGRFPPDATIALLKQTIGNKRSQQGDLKRVMVDTPRLLKDDINDLIDYTGDNSVAAQAQLGGIWNSIISTVTRYLEAEAMYEKVSEEIARTGTLTITEVDIRAEASKMAGLDLRKLDEMDAQRLDQIEQRIRTRFIGQSRAVSEVAGAVKRYKAGRRKKNAPIATFLFTGPTGTGKTALAHTLAWVLFGDPGKVMTIDIPQCVGRGGKTLLFGPDPGFVGFDQREGEIPDRLKKKENRHGVLLLDEIDKTDQEVYESLLVMLDQGYVQSKKTGENYSLEDIVVIMASNQGEAQMMKPEQLRELAKGNAAVLQVLTEQNRQIAKNSFQNAVDEIGREKYSPAFLNRLQVIPFDYLTEEEILAIADIMLNNYVEQVSRDQKIEIVLGENEAEYKKIKAYLVARGMDLVRGARPLKDAIENHMDNPFSSWLIQNNVSGKYVIGVSVIDGQLVFKETQTPSIRGRKMDVAHIHGRGGIVLRAIKRLVEGGREIEAGEITELLALPKGREGVELWFEENPLPAGEMEAKLQALQAAEQNLSAEDLKTLKSEVSILLESENLGVLAFGIYLARKYKLLKSRERIESLCWHADPFVSDLARAALETIERISKYNIPSGNILINAGNKNKIDPEVNDMLAGFQQLLSERRVPEEDIEAVSRAVSTLVYLAKERQEKLDNEKNRNAPLTLTWEIDSLDNVKITVSNSDILIRREEPRLTQFRSRYADGAKRILSVETAKEGTVFSFSVKGGGNRDELNFRRFVPPIPPPKKPPVQKRTQDKEKRVPVSSSAPGRSFVSGNNFPRADKSKESALQALLLDIIKAAQSPEIIARINKLIVEQVSEVNPDISSLEDLINYPGWDTERKIEILKELFEIAGASESAVKVDVTERGAGSIVTIGTELENIKRAFVGQVDQVKAVFRNFAEQLKKIGIIIDYDDNNK